MSHFLIASAFGLCDGASMMADEIIAAFGGTKPVAEITGASRNAVSNWTRFGIPAKYWPLLARTAKTKRVRRINLEVLESHRWP